MDLQRAARRLGAISLVVGPLAVVVGSFVEPASYDDPVTRILDRVAAHPGAQHVLIACDLLALLLLPQIGQEQSAEDAQRYELAEQEARSHGVGLWSDGQPMPPWDWRKTAR